MRLARTTLQFTRAKVHDLLAGLPFTARELEWSGPHHLLDGLIGRSGGESGWHHDGNVAGGLSERLQHGPERLSKFQREGLSVYRYELRNVGHKTAYAVRYRVPLEVTRARRDGTEPPEEHDILGGAMITFTCFLVLGRTNRDIEVSWYDKPGRAGLMRHWRSEVPPPKKD